MTDTADRPSLLRRWGEVIGEHPWRVVAAWAVLVAMSFALALGALGNEPLFDRLGSGEISSPGDARDARDLVEAAGGGGYADDTMIMRGVDLTDTQAQAAALEALADLNDVNGVAQVAHPLLFPDGPSDARAAPFVRPGEGQASDVVTVVGYESSLTADELEQARARVADGLGELAEASEASSSSTGSVKDLVDAIVGQVSTDMKRGEGIALPISFVVMVLVFGGFLAAGLPILGAIASIGGALAALLGFSHLIDLDATVVNIVTVLGLGLCIDYGLLVVSRFREELRAAGDVGPGAVTHEQVVAATGRTLDRAGRTVIFSAVTVAISMAGLLFFPTVFMRASGAAGMSVVVLALLVATSLIPALSALGARRLLRKGTETSGDEGIFSRLAEWVQRAPWLVITAVLVVLVTLALPSLQLRTTSSGAELLPTSAPERQFIETLAEDFPGLSSPQVSIVTTAPAEQVQRWAEQEAPQLPGVEQVGQVEQIGTTDAGDAVQVLGLRTGEVDPLGERSRDLVAALHADRPPFDAAIGGQASSLRDFTSSTLQRAPFALALVILATFALLFLMTGSVVIPVKALVMNVVSLGASLGALVWIFQYGHLQGVLDFSSVGAVEATIVVLVLAFGFGLSMDYEVFLLARIVELHERGVPTDEAVRLGLQRSGRIITSAALLMVIVFSGFVTAQVLAVKETGVALVLAIVLDATLVRMLLVPATMTVLGEWNWWAPRWMRPLHARFGITE